MALLNMNKDTQQFLNILFDDDEYICPCSRIQATHTLQLKNYLWGKKDQWIAINPFKPHTTRQINNIAKFRNFLIEFDNLSLNHQLNLVDILKMPYSTHTFSGNKSYHFIISLEEPVTKDQYKDYCVKLKRILIDADTACFEPSSLTRLAGSYRGKVEQQLIRTTRRIDNKQFQLWIDSFHLKPIKKKENNNINSGELSNFTKNLLEFGIRKSKVPRHVNLKNICIDLFKCGYSENKAKELLIPALLKYNKDKNEEEVIRMVEWVFNQSDLGE